MSITLPSALDMSTAWHYVLSTDTYTRLAVSPNVKDYAFFPGGAAVGDCVVFSGSNGGSLGKYRGAMFNIVTAVAATGYTYVWEYGYFDPAVHSTLGVSWAALPDVHDHTNGFQNTSTLAVYWRIPDDWANYNDMVEGHNYSDRNHYQWVVRCRITGLTAMTNTGLHGATSSSVVPHSISAVGEPTLTFADLYAADKAGQTTLTSRNSFVVEGTPVMNDNWLRPADYKTLGGARNDLWVNTIAWFGLTDFTIRLFGTDILDNAQTEDIVVNAVSVNFYATKSFKTLHQTQIVAVTGTGILNLVGVYFGQWGMVHKLSDSSYGFECNLTTGGTTVLTSQQENILFMRNWYSFIWSDLVIGLVDTTGHGYFGSDFIFENHDGNMINCAFGQNGSDYRNTNIRVKDMEDNGHYAGFWGGGVGSESDQTLNGVYTEGFRQMTWDNSTTPIVGASAYDAHIEPPGAIIEGCAMFGSTYSVRPDATSGAYIHQLDASGATSSPVNPWYIQTTDNWVMDAVDFNWGAFVDTAKFRWAIAPTVPYTNCVAWETYSLELNIVDPAGNPIEGALAVLTDKDGVEVFSYPSYACGYVGPFGERQYTVVDNYAYNISSSWAVDEWWYQEVLFTTGALAGTRRIIKRGNTVNFAYFHKILPTSTGSFDRYVFIPYIRVKKYVPTGFTPSTTVWSTVTDYRPHQLKVTASGYKDHEEIFNVLGPTKKTVVLNKRRYPNR